MIYENQIEVYERIFLYAVSLSAGCGLMINKLQKL